MKKLYFLLWIILLTGAREVVNAQVKLPRLVSDGMVLQRDAEIPVWGWASPNERITISFNGKTYKTKAGADKRWKVKLVPMEAGGPYTMEIEGKSQVSVKDILIGDVWVCSGQSNMEFWMGRVKTKYADEIANSTNPLIREFDVKPVYDFSMPLEDVESEGWKTANPENVLQFTAVGYFFAKSLFEKYRVPIGLIHSSKGGTPAEAWISGEALKVFPGYDLEAQKWKDSSLIKRTIEQDQNRFHEWYENIKNNDQGLADPEHPWYSKTTDCSSWDEMQVPGFWDNQRPDPVDGVVWCRKEVEVPASLTGKKAILHLGNIADQNTTYLNGIKIGETNSRYFPSVYDVPENLLKPGKNIITVRVVNQYNGGGFIKDKPYNLTIGEHEISLEGQWKYKVGITTRPFNRGTIFFYKPLGLYNGMIAPLINYKIKGVIWYQGEANTKNPAEYRKLFPALITDWRNHWGQGDFPFLFVQLTSYLPAVKEPSESQWAELREAQLMTLSLPNTGMAVTIDIGEWNDVHPVNKKDVGERLALAAQKTAYHEKQFVYSGPIYRLMSVAGNKVVISFDHTGSGLTTSNRDSLKYFTIAGSDGKFAWAKAKIQDNKVVVWNDTIDHPVAVRYGWADNPEGANLFNREGLPASPFRTDHPDINFANHKN